jgi:hypothetical protein
MKIKAYNKIFDKRQGSQKFLVFLFCTLSNIWYNIVKTIY